MTDPSACCPSRKADPAGALFRTSARVISAARIASTIARAAELLETIRDKATAEGMQGIYDKYVISPDRIADIVAFAVDAPEERVINEFTIGPANQPW